MGVPLFKETHIYMYGTKKDLNIGKQDGEMNSSYLCFFGIMFRHNYSEFINQWWRWQNGFFFCFLMLFVSRDMGICLESAIPKVKTMNRATVNGPLNVFSTSEQFSWTCFTVLLWRLCISLNCLFVSFSTELKCICGHYIILTYLTCCKDFF